MSRGTDPVKTEIDTGAAGQSENVYAEHRSTKTDGQVERLRRSERTVSQRTISVSVLVVYGNQSHTLLLWVARDNRPS